MAESRADFLIYKLGGGSSKQGGGGGVPPGGMPPGGMPPGAPGAGMPPGARPPGGGTGGNAQKSTYDGPRIVLPGKIQVNGGPTPTVSYTHPTLKDEPLYFRLTQVEILRAATPKDEYRRLLGQAGKDPDAVLKAALWALKKGLLTDFYVGVNKVLENNPTHEAALRIMELKKQMDQSLPDNPATEAELRSIVGRTGMKVQASKHFLLLHDTDAKPEKGHRKNRATERLELLEKVYESFLLLFHAQDVQLDIPQERLKVVLFKEYNNFHEYATSLSPALASAAGFWEPIRNVSYFFDNSTTEESKGLKKEQVELQKVVEDAKRNRDGDTIRFIKTINLLIAVEQENADITVVSHEATHQLAGNTGLLPRHVEIPRWVHEGLATYFEAPGDASWAGIGAVNELRLKYYRALKDDLVHSNIDFIVGDQIFDFARSHGAVLHGYGQAWALTHFMLENHIKEFVGFYRMLGEMPPDVALDPDLLKELFSRVFGSDHKALDREWRSYMRTLKTDFERLEDTSSKKGK